MLDTEALNKALSADLGRTKQPTEDSTSQHYAAWLLQNNLTKKYSDGTTNVLAERAAREKFLDVNRQVGRWEAPVAGTVVSNILSRAAKLFQKQFFDAEGYPIITMAHAFNNGMVGPGASIDATSDVFVEKLFNSKLTCTHPILYKYYVQAIANNKTWRKAERARTFRFSEYSVVEGNKLFYVPKETVIARTAATEPTLNMFGQLGYGKCIEKILESEHSIRLDTQPNINRWLAKSGSLNKEYATIDLSSASDTIGLGLLELILPKPLLADLKLLRSPTTKIGKSKIKLNMISTMGNGFTFPLETWVFANLVLATMLELRVSVFDVYGKRRYSVFGDDIICPTKVYEVVRQVLTGAGFKVNETKSFASGSFRESCGGDYFKGVNVRAVYCKAGSDDSHVYSLLNRLVDWSATHKVYLPNTTRYLRSLVQFRPVPLYEDEGVGIRVPLRRLTNRKVSKEGHFIYRPRIQLVDKITPLTRLIERDYHGFKVALLHGSFRHGRLVPRTKPGCATFKVVKALAPINWDFTPDARLNVEERRNAFERNFAIS